MPAQIFFTHVMKTGGTSIGRVLRRCFPDDATYPTASDRAMVTAKTFPHLLVGLDEEAKRAVSLFSVHQPAWVAFRVAPEATKVTVLREPVSRTISHLRQLSASPATSNDLAEIYAESGWRDRLANYQTQLFADTEERVAKIVAEMPRADELDDDAKELLRRDLARFWETGIAHPFAVGPDDYARAVHTLDRFDCVGVMDDLPALASCVRTRTGLDIADVPHVNLASRTDAVSPALVAQIADDNRYDTQLYEHAVTLAARRRSA